MMIHLAHFPDTIAQQLFPVLFFSSDDADRFKNKKVACGWDRTLQRTRGI